MTITHTVTKCSKCSFADLTRIINTNLCENAAKRCAESGNKIFKNAKNIKIKAKKKYWSNKRNNNATVNMLQVSNAVYKKQIEITNFKKLQCLDSKNKQYFNNSINLFKTHQNTFALNKRKLLNKKKKINYKSGETKLKAAVHRRNETNKISKQQFIGINTTKMITKASDANSAITINIPKLNESNKIQYSSKATSTTLSNVYMTINNYKQMNAGDFLKKYGRILLIAVCISLGIACSILVAVVHCYRATTLKRRATVYLALPIPLLPENQTLLNSELPEHSVPMLSVQTAGCAGMERLGVPTRTSLNTPPDDRGQFICRMRVDAIQARELLAVRGDTVILNNSGNNSQTSNNTNHHQQQLQQHNHHKQQQQQQHSHQNQHHLQQNNTTHQPQHYQRMTTPNNSSVSGNFAARSSTSNVTGNIARSGDIEATTLKYVNTGTGSKANLSSTTVSSSDSYVNAINGHNNEHHQNYKNHLQQQQVAFRCPYHVPLPDSEWGQDRNLQIRTAYQQSEITRSYITPAPNKTIKDVPEQSNYSFAAITQQQHFNSLSPTPSPSPQHLHQHQHQLHPPTPQNKSKSVITKLFSRKSSPKSPNALSGSSSTNSSLTSSASMSSSASSLASGMSASVSASSLAATPLATLPIATATTLKTTPCNYGATTSATLSAHSTTTTAQHMISIGIAAPTTAAIDRIPTPPLAVLVPIACQTQTQQKVHEQQFDNIVAEHAHAASSCFYSSSSNSNISVDMTLTPAVNVVTTTLPQALTEAAALSSTSVITPMHVALPTTNMSRNNSNSSMVSCSCSCNSKTCDICNTAKS